MIRKLAILLNFFLIIALITGCQVSVDDNISKNIARLKLSNPYLRKQAITSLGSTGDERVILPIAQMLSDDDVEVVAQAYQELDKLRELGLAVDNKIILAFNDLSKKTRSDFTKYLIFAHQNGVDIQAELFDILPQVDFEVEQLTNLLVYLHTRPDSGLYAHLLADLASENGGLAAKVLLLLDQNGFPPQGALIEEIIAQGANISEALGQLLAQFACRESYDIQHGLDNQLQIYVREGEVIVKDNSRVSRERCLKGDSLWNKTPTNLSWASRLVFLVKTDDIPKSVENLFTSFIDIDHISMVNAIANDMDSLVDEPELHQVLVSTLSDNTFISEWLDEELKPTEVIAVLATPPGEENKKNNSKGILIIDSTTGELLDLYHWYLPKNHRPHKQDDIRYVLSVPEKGNKMTMVDLYSREVVFEETVEEDNIIMLLESLIVITQET